MKSSLVKNLIVWLGSLVLPILLQAQPFITFQPANQSVHLGSNASFSVMVSGTGPFVYQWQFNGTNLPNNFITTVAGNGIGSYSGDGGLGTNASLHNPFGIALDASGNLFIADAGNNRIRKVDTSGIITTVAGTGNSIYAGDGAAATNANLSNPCGITLDTSGNLFVADYEHNRVRKVGTNGIITTIAGNGGFNFSGDGGAATNASLNGPSGTALDNVGNIFISDLNNSRIRKVGTNGIITTVAGNGSFSFSGDGGAATNASLHWPSDVTLDANGNMYIADTPNNRIRAVNTNGIIMTVVGSETSGFYGDGGAATNARLNLPFSVAIDVRNNLFIADHHNNRIRKVDTNGIITTVAGNGSLSYSGDGGIATDASLNYPSDVAFDSVGNLYIADSDNNRIRKVTLAGIPTLILSNLSLTNAGNYNVIVTDPSGSITSSVVVLTVVVPPKNLIARLAPGSGLELQFTGTTNYPYILQSTTNLMPPVSWQTILTNFTDLNGNWNFMITNTHDVSARFYRTYAQ